MSKSRKKSLTEELCLWFWSEILKKQDGAYTSPEWWRYMRESKILLSKPPRGRGYDIDIIKRAVGKVLQNSNCVTSLFAVEWLKGGKTYYELASDPMADMPPIYEQSEYRRWCEVHGKSFA